MIGPIGSSGIDKRDRFVADGFGLEVGKICQRVVCDAGVSDERVVVEVLGWELHDLMVHSVLDGQLSCGEVVPAADESFHHAHREAFELGLVAQHRRW